MVMALGDDHLTTKQVHARLPDVAQASLYRAMTRLVDAGVIEVVERRRKGGAIERVYCAVQAASDSFDADPSSLRATADAVAQALQLDATRWLALNGDADQAAVRRHVLRLNPEKAAQLRESLDDLITSVAAYEDESASPMALTVALFPSVPVR